MHPKTVHQTTSKAPDSGLKLGFADISSSTANHQNTPTKSAPRHSTASVAPPNFEFRFTSDANLSEEARRLMNDVRQDAARIKAEMAAGRALQDKKEGEAEKMFDGQRKIAQPKGRAGRFSDVHMAQFKKMDSIANHPSAFRARPGFAGPTAQSLKRSPSKADLDEPERPRTAGKTTPRRIPPPVTGRVMSISPFKSIPSASKTSENDSPAKRIRYSEHQDTATIPTPTQPRSVATSSLYSPTKSSLARATGHGLNSPEKPSMLPRSNSVKSLKVTSPMRPQAEPSRVPIPVSPSKAHQLGNLHSKPLPAVPDETLPASKSVQIAKDTAPTHKEGSFASRLPTFAGLKSILRSGRKAEKSPERPGTPKRLNASAVVVESPKKVDFTPSVKSRYAVKLAGASPSPAKFRDDTPHKPPVSTATYDSSAYLIQDDIEEDWEDADDDVAYPSLPSSEYDEGPVDHTFSAKAKEYKRRESREFKSIFTTLHSDRPATHSTLASVNTTVNKTNPGSHVDQIMRSPGNSTTEPSPSTIRRVRTSGVTALVEPFEDSIQTVPHGIPGKKRRFESIVENDKQGTDDDAKENRQISSSRGIPGGWNDTILDEDDMQVEDVVDDEGTKRGGKRARTTNINPPKPLTVKKPSAAREAAAKTANERKGKGISASRLMALSRPKQRG